MTMPEREKVAGPYSQPQAKASAAQPSETPGAGTLLPHLAGPAAALRQVLAAHLVRRCPHIIEIGGAGLPITGFLTHSPTSVTVIDPKIPAFAAESLNGAPCRVRHLAAKLQQVALTPPPEAYALVLLGLSLKPFGRSAAVPAELLALARAADVLVIEHALDLGRASGQIGTLPAARQDRPAIDLELRLNDAALALAGYDRRRFLAFGA